MRLGYKKSWFFWENKVVFNSREHPIFFILPHSIFLNLFQGDFLLIVTLLIVYFFVIDLAENLFDSISFFFSFQILFLFLFHSFWNSQTTFSPTWYSPQLRFFTIPTLSCSLGLKTKGWRYDSFFIFRLRVILIHIGFFSFRLSWVQQRIISFWLAFWLVGLKRKSCPDHFHI